MEKEFIVGEHTYRPKQMSATEVIALESVLNFNDVDKAQYMFESFLERIEVNIMGVWQPVKRKGLPELTPNSLNTNLRELYEICTKFAKIVIEPVFQKSEESKKSQ